MTEAVLARWWMQVGGDSNPESCGWTQIQESRTGLCAAGLNQNNNPQFPADITQFEIFEVIAQQMRLSCDPAG